MKFIPALALAAVLLLTGDSSLGLFAAAVVMHRPRREPAAPAPAADELAHARLAADLLHIAWGGAH